jgi:uncharacterized protein YecT (DUF1311 family)
MRSTIRLLAAAMASMALSIPATALDDYSQFPQPATDSLLSTGYYDCIGESRAEVAAMRDCIVAERQRLEPGLDAAYQGALAGSVEKSALESEHGLWRETRQRQCAAEAVTSDGEVVYDLLFQTCVLKEVVRRTLWLEGIAG